MFAEQPRAGMSEAEYLAFEAASDMRHEFHDGEIFAMSGGILNHALIAGNTLTILNIQAQRRGCRIFPNDMKIRTGSGNHYYPDASALCGTPELTADNPPSLLNPTTIIEVLSESTEVFDRDKKFRHYKTIPSLSEYVLIAQKEPLIERYLRQPSGEWSQLVATDSEAVINLPSLDIRLTLADVYINGFEG